MSDSPSIAQALAEALAEAEARRDRAATELSAAEKLVDALRFTMDMNAQANMSKAPGLMNGHATESGAVQFWRQLSRRSAIQRVLADVGKPMSPKDLAEELHRRGRTDAASGVSATLSRLKDDNRVESPGYGLWRLTTPETEERLATH